MGRELGVLLFQWLAPEIRIGGERVRDRQTETVDDVTITDSKTNLDKCQVVSERLRKTGSLSD